MSKKVLDNLLTEWKLIDSFVIAYDNPKVSSIWHSICESSYFRDGTLLTTERDSIKEIFLNYESFLYSISVEDKLEYISFYESQLGVAWKEKYYDAREVKEDRLTTIDLCMVDLYGSTRWWENNCYIEEYLD